MEKHGVVQGEGETPAPKAAEVKEADDKKTEKKPPCGSDTLSKMADVVATSNR